MNKRRIKSYFFKALFFSVFAVLSICVVNTGFAQKTAFDNKELREAKNLYNSDKFGKAKTKFYAVEKEYCQNDSAPEICLEAKIGLIDIANINGKSKEAETKIRESKEFVHKNLERGHFYHAIIAKYLLLNAINKNQMDEANDWANWFLEFIDREVSEPHTLAVALSAIAFYEDTRGNYEVAIQHFEAAIEQLSKVERTNETDHLLFQLHNNLGVSYKNIGKLDEAKSQYELSLDISYRLHGDENKKVAGAFINIGGIYYSKGDIGLAAEYFERSVEMFMSLTGDFSSELGASLNNLAATQYMLGIYDKSAEYFEEAQRIKEENLGYDHPETAIGYSNLATIHILNNDFDAAKANYEKAIVVKENIYGSNHPSLIDTKVSLGDLYNQKLKQHGQARVHYKSALSIVLDRLGETHPEVTNIVLRLGESFIGNQMYTEAEKYIDLSLTNLYGPHNFNESFDPERRITYPVTLMKALIAKSQVLINKQENVDIENYQKALVARQWAADLVDLIQKSYKNEASKLRLVETNYSIYTGAVEILYSLYNKTGNEKYLDQVFDTIEKSRSRVTLELIQNSNAKKFAGVPLHITEHEESLNRKITDMQQELHHEENKGLEMDSLRVRALRDSIFYYKRDVDEFTDELEEKYPSYYHLKYDQSIISRADAQSLLQRDEVVLSYIFGSERGFVLVVTKKSVNLVELRGLSDIEDLVIEMKEYVLTDNLDAYRQRAHKLYELLIQPAEPHITGNELIIMADQSLHYLPFEMLLKEVPDHNRYSSYPYLLHEFVFSYVPSLTLLEEMNSRKEEEPRNLLALAPFSSEVSGQDKVLMDHQYSDRANPLYLTQYETASISSEFKNNISLNEYFNPQRTELLLGNEATFSRFSQTDLSDYDYIHFATHAFVNEENPEFSAILLYPEEGNSGATYVGDIYNLELDANLVVLGACQTGMGSVYKGEGMIGFTRAFIYAGASNLAVSMWRVSDQPTAYLMIDFYEFIRKGHDYSDALRLAKLNMISNPQFANPVNWAAFTLTGR